MGRVAASSLVTEPSLLPHGAPWKTSATRATSSGSFQGGGLGLTHEILEERVGERRPSRKRGPSDSLQPAAQLTFIKAPGGGKLGLAAHLLPRAFILDQGLNF